MVSGLKGYPEETTVAVKKLKRKSLLIMILPFIVNFPDIFFFIWRVLNVHIVHDKLLRKLT